MRKVTPRDAFLVHDPADAYLAQAVVERFEAGGVTVFSPVLSQPTGAKPFSETVLGQLWGSAAFVVLLTPTHAKSLALPSYCGAALVTHPFERFVLNAGVPVADIPDYFLAEWYTTAPLWDGVPGVIERIAEAAKPLPPDQAVALLRVSDEFGLSPTELVQSNTDREEFARRFAKESGVRLPEFRLVRELIRLRRAKKPAARNRTLAK